MRAHLRRMVRRVRRRHGCPPAKAEQATVTGLAHAEVIAKDWAG